MHADLNFHWIYKHPVDLLLPFLFRLLYSKQDESKPQCVPCPELSCSENGGFVSTSALLLCLKFTAVCCGLQFERSNVHNPLSLVCIVLVCPMSIALTQFKINTVLTTYRTTHCLTPNGYAFRPTLHIVFRVILQRKSYLSPPPPPAKTALEDWYLQ
jgi:hypothetical protein